MGHDHDDPGGCGHSPEEHEAMMHDAMAQGEAPPGMPDHLAAMLGLKPAGHLPQAVLDRLLALAPAAKAITEAVKAGDTNTALELLDERSANGPIHPEDCDLAIKLDGDLHTLAAESIRLKKAQSRAAVRADCAGSRLNAAIEAAYHDDLHANGSRGQFVFEHDGAYYAAPNWGTHPSGAPLCRKGAPGDRLTRSLKALPPDAKPPMDFAEFAKSVGIKPPSDPATGGTLDDVQRDLPGHRPGNYL